MHRRTITLTASLGLVLMFVSSAALAQYQLTNLVSNQAGVAPHTDPLIVNAWGMVHAPGSPWWISDNNSGWSSCITRQGCEARASYLICPVCEATASHLPLRFTKTSVHT